MKSYLPLLTFAILLTSCSSVYKSGQTPDDVYFSPTRPQDEYVRVEKRDNRMYRNDDVALEDRYLRMRVRNRRYAFLDDDYDYYYGSNYNRYNDYYRVNTIVMGNWWTWNNGYSSYYYNPGYYNSHYYSPYYYNPYYGNPYYSGVVYGNVTPVYNKPRTGNLQVFGVSGKNNSSRSNVKVYSNSTSSDENYRNSGNNAGSYMRNTFGTNNNNNSSSNNNNSSSSSSSSSSNSSSSSSSSGSSHAPVRKF